MEWKEIANLFYTRWNMPNCLGAIDGKHIEIIKPAHSGATYINCKGYFSVVLMALVDADYQLIYVDVGAEGRMSDGGVFAHCSLSAALKNNSLNIPKRTPLPATNVAVPYYIFGDDAFPLKTYIMKPYSKQDLSEAEGIFNYRLSKARRISENAFGIMANVFRVLQTPIMLSPEKVEKVVMAMYVLYNFLRQAARSSYISPFVEGDNIDSNTLLQLKPAMGKNSSNEAKAIRDELKNYFVDAERVPWQDEQCYAF